MTAIPVQSSAAPLRAHISRLRSTVLSLGNELALGIHGLRTRRLTAGSEIACAGYTVKINDGLNFHVLYKDLFVRRIYHFDSARTEPLVLDCGSNIGMSILYVKSVYPRARIVGFEPDPVVWPYLQENVSRNRLENVSLHQAALAAKSGTLTLYSDAVCGSAMSGHVSTDTDVRSTHEVPCVRLRDYLTERVDFLKMNIEGAEWEVLNDCGDKLRLVDQLIIEYHHLPGLERNLHKILTLLHDNGFEYLINDFDSETNAGVAPPFSLTTQSRYFLLIYARRTDATAS